MRVITELARWGERPSFLFSQKYYYPYPSHNRLRGFIATFNSNEKEFNALAVQLQKVQEEVANLGKEFSAFKESAESTQVKSSVALSKILDGVVVNQVQYDEMIEMLRMIGRKKGFKMD